MMDGEEGHFLPAVGLAKGLRKRQHRVLYAGVIDCAGFVREQGFEMIPIMQDFIPAGVSEVMGKKGYKTHYFKALIEGDVLDAVVAEVKPEAIIINSFYGAEALAIKYRYGLPVILLTTHFRPFSKRQMATDTVMRLMEMSAGVTEFIDLLNKSDISPKSFKDLEDLYMKLPEAVLKPSTFNTFPDEDLVCMTGIGIDYERTEEQFDIDLDERPLIFCSLGSQNHLRLEASRNFYQLMIETMLKCPDWRAIISCGKKISLSAFRDVPSNVILTGWAPQIQILRRCTVMVNHGGWGAVKECIAFGVPMLSVPLMRDHFDCANQVCRLGIGLQAGIEKISVTELRDLLATLIRDVEIRERMSLVRAEAKLEDGREKGVHFIESFLSSGKTDGLADNLCA